MPRRSLASAASDKGLELLAQLIGIPASGAYVIGETTGLITGLGNLAEIFQLRNPTGSASLLVVTNVLAVAELTTAYTAAQENVIDLIRSTAWTADGTGGTALLGNKKYSGCPTSVVASGNARIATTAGLGAGTKTLDGQKLAVGTAYEANTALTYSKFKALAEPDPTGIPVAILAAQEGISIRTSPAMGATGVMRIYVRVEWYEIPSS